MFKSSHFVLGYVGFFFQMYLHAINFLSPIGWWLIIGVLCALAYQILYPTIVKRFAGEGPYKLYSPIPIKLNGTWSLSFYVIDNMTMISKEELFRLRLLGVPVTIHDKHADVMRKLNSKFS